TSGGVAPPASRNSVFSVDVLSSEKVIWKPLRPCVLVVTVTAVSASMTSLDTGTGTTGPIISESWIPLDIAPSRNAFRQRDAQRAARRLGQLVGAHGAVGVAQAPPQL